MADDDFQDIVDGELAYFCIIDFFQAHKSFVWVGKEMRKSLRSLIVGIRMKKMTSSTKL